MTPARPRSCAQRNSGSHGLQVLKAGVPQPKKIIRAGLLVQMDGRTGLHLGVLQNSGTILPGSQSTLPMRASWHRWMEGLAYTLYAANKQNRPARPPLCGRSGHWTLSVPSASTGEQKLS